MIWTLFLALVAPTAFADDHDRFYRAFYLDLAEGKTEAAIAEYRELLTAFEDDPDHRAWVRVRLAACQLRLGKRDRALEALEAAAEVKGIGEAAERALAEVREQLQGRDASESGETTSPAKASETRQAVEAGLRYLIGRQEVDGRWSSQTEIQGRMTGLKGLDSGVTALVVTTLHEFGASAKPNSDAGRALDRGLRWLVGQQDAEGRIGYSRGCEEWIYNHGLATRALADIYRSTRRPDLHDPVTRAVEYILDHQNRGFGWKYDKQGGRNDTSVTATMIDALVLARELVRELRIDVEPTRIDQSIQWAQRWTNRVTAHSTGRTGYEAPGDEGARLRKLRKNIEFKALPAMTAAGMFVRFVAGEAKDSRPVRQGASLLMERNHLPSYSAPEGLKLGKINFVYWHWGTRTMRVIGGPSWEKWRGEVLRALLPHQREDGAWDAAGQWSLVGGRVLSTALAVSTLIEAER